MVIENKPSVRLGLNLGVCSEDFLLCGTKGLQSPFVLLLIVSENIRVAVIGTHAEVLSVGDLPMIND